jgi:hypothetical protein
MLLPPPAAAATPFTQAVRPQHFLPVHGEYAFLTEHALLARERAGVNFVDVSRKPWVLHSAGISSVPRWPCHVVMLL